MSQGEPDKKIIIKLTPKPSHSFKVTSSGKLTSQDKSEKRS